MKNYDGNHTELIAKQGNQLDRVWESEIDLQKKFKNKSKIVTKLCSKIERKTKEKTSTLNLTQTQIQQQTIHKHLLHNHQTFRSDKQMNI